MNVKTDVYKRVHGREPRGRSYWRFLLVTDRVTEKDHCYNSKCHETYDAALKAAIELAERRRCHTVMVFP